MSKILVFAIITCAFNSAFAGDAEKCASVFSPTRFFIAANERATRSGVDTMKIQDYMTVFVRSELIKLGNADPGIAKGKGEAYADYILGAALNSAGDGGDVGSETTVRLDAVWAKGSNDQFIAVYREETGCKFVNDSDDDNIPVDLSHSSKNTLTVLKGKRWNKQTFRKVNNSVFTEKSEGIDPKTGKPEIMVVVHRLLVNLEAVTH